MKISRDEAILEMNVAAFMALGAPEEKAREFLRGNGIKSPQTIKACNRDMAAAYDRLVDLGVIDGKR